MAELSSIKLINSLAFFNLNIYSDLEFTRMIGAKIVFFESDKLHLPHHAYLL